MEGKSRRIEKGNTLYGFQLLRISLFKQGCYRFPHSHPRTPTYLIFSSLQVRTSVTPTVSSALNRGIGHTPPITCKHLSCITCLPGKLEMECQPPRESLSRVSTSQTCHRDLVPTQHGFASVLPLKSHPSLPILLYIPVKTQGNLHIALLPDSASECFSQQSQPV